MLKTLFAAALLAASTSLLAQAQAPSAPGAEAKERQARQACEGKKGDERRACVGTAMCAETADPAKCEARLKARAEKHKQRRESQKQPEKK